MPEACCLHSSQDRQPTLRMEFKEVYDAHFAFVWRSLLRLRVPEPSLKDAMQDVFVVVHRRLPDFEGRSKVSTWLFGVCLRVAKDYRRRAHVRREVLDDRDFSAIPDLDHDPSVGASRLEDRRLIEAGLDALDLDQRAVFVLFELESASGDEIAEALSIPLGTVYSRLRLARQSFKRAVLARSHRPLKVGGS